MISEVFCVFGCGAPGGGGGGGMAIARYLYVQNSEV